MIIINYDIVVTIYTIILYLLDVHFRHGESIWNVNDPRRGLVSRFTVYIIYMYLIFIVIMQNYFLHVTDTIVIYFTVIRDGRIFP